MNKNSTHINRLSELSPAGTQLVLDPKTGMAELLRLTLLDLTLRQVLSIERPTKRSQPRVTAGKNFKDYKPHKFESYFTEPITDKPLILKKYLKLISNNLPEEEQYKREIIKGLNIKDLFNNAIISYIFSWITTSKKGKAFKANVTDYLNEIDTTINDLINNDPQKAVTLFQFLKGNVFLLKNLDFKRLEKLKLDTLPKTDTNIVSNDALFDTFFVLYPIVSMAYLMSQVSDTFNAMDYYFDSDSDSSSDEDFSFDFD